MTIYARDGGTDANDWAEMLLRMYIQWASQHGHQVSLLDRSDNDIAGINNATICVRGSMAYGYLKGETGIHRLVRISPFNSEGKRQTSFAAIDVSPEISDDIEIEIDEKDVREDCTFGLLFPDSCSNHLVDNVTVLFSFHQLKGYTQEFMFNILCIMILAKQRYCIFDVHPRDLVLYVNTGQPFFRFSQNCLFI